MTICDSSGGKILGERRDSERRDSERLRRSSSVVQMY